MEWLHVFWADEAGLISHRPGLAGRGPQLSSGSIVDISWTCERKTSGGGELGLLRPPALLDADE
eukprot:14176259-Alexandrium_andersonii.AAC.1